jgi:hypothetical protein
VPQHEHFGIASSKFPRQIVDDARFIGSFEAQHRCLLELGVGAFGAVAEMGVVAAQILDTLCELELAGTERGLRLLNFPQPCIVLDRDSLAQLCHLLRRAHGNVPLLAYVEERLDDAALLLRHTGRREGRAVREQLLLSDAPRGVGQEFDATLVTRRPRRCSSNRSTHPRKTAKVGRWGIA